MAAGCPRAAAEGRKRVQKREKDGGRASGLFVPADAWKKRENGGGMSPGRGGKPEAGANIQMQECFLKWRFESAVF